MRMLLRILAGLILVFASFCNAGRRPIELRVVRNKTTNSCQFLSVQETQVHKGLVAALKNGRQYVKEMHTYDSTRTPDGKLKDGLEQFSFFSYEETILRDRARSLCGYDESNWDFPVFDSYAPRVVHQQSPSQHILFTSDLGEQSLPLEVQPLVESGASKNRIDFVFFADGYTLREKAKFLADATRLADDITTNQTFNTVKPLLNIWAAFTPSVDSGIGVGGTPKDTAFGLYRYGTELRGVYYSKANVARLACASMDDRCDYPILMGNDPLYGGLGGEFTVITPSVLNGALVLRHELGHSIINVGEEYDGGDENGYFGCNAADTPEKIGWAHWLSDYAGMDSGNAEFPSSGRVERTVMSLQQYPWTILNTTYSAKFRSPGTYPSNAISFSISGIPESEQLTVSLDGKDLGWRAQGGVGKDRYFYEFRTTETEPGLSQGEHELKFVLNYPTSNGTASQLCSVEVLEYGNVNEFNSTPGYYGIFPTFSEKNTTSFRPTNTDCLMRRVTSPNFCKVCIEGLWISLMSRVDIVESAKTDCYIERSHGVEDGEWSWKRSFEIGLLPLAQFRRNGTSVDKQEAYEIIWSRRRRAGDILRPSSLEGTRSAIWLDRDLEQDVYHSALGDERQVFHQFTNKTELVLDEVGDRLQEGDVISVDVTFLTEEVRVDTDRRLTGGGDWVVRTKCGFS